MARLAILLGVLVSLATPVAMGVDVRAWFLMQVSRFLGNDAMNWVVTTGLPGLWFRVPGVAYTSRDGVLIGLWNCAPVVGFGPVTMVAAMVALWLSRRRNTIRNHAILLLLGWGVPVLEWSLIPYFKPVGDWRWNMTIRETLGALVACIGLAACTGAFRRLANGDAAPLTSRTQLWIGLSTLFGSGATISAVSTHLSNSDPAWIPHACTGASWLWLIAMIVLPLWWGIAERRRPDARNRCRKCGYDLVGLPVSPTVSQTCPECGLGIEQHDLVRL